MGVLPYGRNREQHQNRFGRTRVRQGRNMQRIKRNLYAALGNADLGRKRNGTWRFYLPFE